MLRNEGWWLRVTAVIVCIQMSLLTRSEEVRLARQREEKEREWREKQLELARQKKEQQDEVYNAIG